MRKDEAIKEIKQLKELLDSGILSQDEYDTKSADLKKIILDSEKKKDEPLESKKEKEYLEKKAENKSQINPSETEEKKLNEKLEVQEEVKLKTPSEESKIEPKKSSSGFRKWLNKKESPLTNFLYVALGFTVIPSGSFVIMTFQKYVLGLIDGSSTYGEYPFESNFIVFFSFFILGAPIILLISYLISLIKSLKVKTAKVFFIFTGLFILLFARNFQTTVYPALNSDKNKVLKTQQLIAEVYFENGKKKMENIDYTGALVDFNKAIKINPNIDKYYQERANAKYGLLDFNGASEDMYKAIQKGPQRYQNFILRGVMGCKMKNERASQVCVDCNFIYEGWMVAKKNGASKKEIKQIEREFSWCLKY